MNCELVTKVCRQSALIQKTPSFKAESWKHSKHFMSGINVGIKITSGSATVRAPAAPHAGCPAEFLSFLLFCFFCSHCYCLAVLIVVVINTRASGCGCRSTAIGWAV